MTLTRTCDAAGHLLERSKIPAGTKLSTGGFYLLGLSNSGLVTSARKGDTVINVRSTTGMKAGDTVSVDTGSSAETRKIASVGTVATASTTMWQPLPDGPIITIPAGATDVPVTSVAGFAVGEKIALGYGATFPAVARDTEKYEVATVTAIGKPGMQALLVADAPAGSANTSKSPLSQASRLATRSGWTSTASGMASTTSQLLGSARRQVAPLSSAPSVLAQPTSKCVT